MAKMKWGAFGFWFYLLSIVICARLCAPARSDKETRERFYGNMLNSSSPESNDGTLAKMFDRVLEKEFSENDQPEVPDKSSFNSSVADQQAVLETVAKITHEKAKRNDTHEGNGTRPFQFQDVFSLENEDSDDVTTLIDKKDNVFVMSNKKSKYPVLQVDLRLISDLVVVIVSAAIGGIVFSCLGQPVIVGYLLAGSLIGPGGLKFISEMVQVETVAQFGVVFLLFALGLEFSLAKLKAVGPVAVLGGLLQIVIFMFLCGILSMLFGAKLSEGVFVGSFLSMSSTAVVVKFLVERNSNSALHVQVTIGTLIFQDCAVGLLFALLPVLGGNSGLLQGIISMGKLLLVLSLYLTATSILSWSFVPRFLKLMMRLSSQTNELYQLASVAFCLLSAWCSDKLGLSLELGSFMAGVMISTTDFGQHTLDQVEPIRNLFAALFLSSIGMLIHVHFLWNHVDILLASVILVIVVKTTVATIVTKAFGYSIKTSFIVGISLAQIGEFAFVLLSRASNLHLVEGKMYLLLLGTTALSLVTTPLLFKLIPAVMNLGVLMHWFPSESSTPNEVLWIYLCLRCSLMAFPHFLHLPFSGKMYSEPVSKYYQKAEKVLKVLKPIIDDATVYSDLASNEVLTELIEDLGLAVEELRELIENWNILSSKFYFVMQVEPLVSRIQVSGLNILQQLKVSQQCLPDDLEPETSSAIKEAIVEQLDGVGPSPEVLAKIAENLGLRSNQEVLIEAVALERLKEIAEQTEKTTEAEYIDQMISVINCMHEHLVMLKQSQSSIPVSVPADFCCPLSLELMTDPVIVASGQTYERAFIKNWIDLGLTVCPKTRQTLVHTNLIPNYTVKALIASWCESNNVKLVDPIKSTNLNQPSLLRGSTESGSAKELPVATPNGGIHQEGTSSLHPHSTPAGSLGGMVNGQHVNLARISPTGSDDGSSSLVEGSMDSVDQSLMSPSRNESSNALSSEQSQTHIRTASDSTALSSANFPQGTQGDNNSAPQLSSNPVDNEDSSGELNQGSDAAAMPTPNREPEFSPQLVEPRSQSQTVPRRSLERFVPRIVSSPSVETRADLSGTETHVRKLVEDLKSTSLDTQREATAELRLLAKHNTDNRIVISNCGAIALLVDLLQSTDTTIQENSVTALLNLSINDNNKTAIADAGAIGPLIHVLKTGSPEAKENSAATLFSLSVVEGNKIKIGRSGAIGPLVDLLGNGTPRGKKDAATALFNLSIFHENKDRIVQAGAIKNLVELMDPAAGMVDKAVAVLANLATIPEGRRAIGQEGGIPVLVEVVELGSARGKENAAAALLHLCSDNHRFLNIVLQEGAVPPLVALSQSGTPRAKEKALGLLNQFRSQRHGSAGRA